MEYIQKSFTYHPSLQAWTERISEAIRWANKDQAKEISA